MFQDTILFCFLQTCHPLRQPQSLFESLTQFSGTPCLHLFPDCDGVALLGPCTRAVFIPRCKSPSKHVNSSLFAQAPAISTAKRLLNIFIAFSLHVGLVLDFLPLNSLCGRLFHIHTHIASSYPPSFPACLPAFLSLFFLFLFFFSFLDFK